MHEEGPLTEFLEGLRTADPPILRVAGTAIFLNPGKETTPLALKAEVERIHALHDTVLIVTLDRVSLSHVELSDRFEVATLGQKQFKVIHVTIRAGYQDSFNIPEELALARKRGLLARNLDLEHASYIVSRMTITESRERVMRPGRKRLFITMARNAGSPIDAFGLPSDRTVIMGSQVSL